MDDGNDGSDVSTTRRPMESTEAATLVDDLEVQNHIYQQLALAKVSGHGPIVVSTIFIHFYLNKYIYINEHIYIYLYLFLKLYNTLYLIL